jgi:hypothetical protein
MGHRGEAGRGLCEYPAGRVVGFGGDEEQENRVKPWGLALTMSSRTVANTPNPKAFSE